MSGNVGGMERTASGNHLLQGTKGDAEEDVSLLASGEPSPRPSAKEGAAARPALKLLHALKVLVYCALYLMIGPTLILVNNHVLRKLHFNYPMALSGLGLLFSSAVSLILVTSGAVQLEHAQEVTRGFYLRNLVPVGLMSATTLAAGNAVYLHLPVGFIQMLKAFTPVVTLLVVGGQHFSRPRVPRLSPASTGAKGRRQRMGARAIQPRRAGRRCSCGSRRRLAAWLSRSSASARERRRHRSARQPSACSASL